MLTSKDIVPTLEKILADQAVFISKLQGITPGTMTRAELHTLEEEVHESFDLLKEMIENSTSGAELTVDKVNGVITLTVPTG